MTGPLALVIAPAGAGKSVLLAQWAGRHDELRFAWMNMEPADDDPVRFSQRLLQGLAAIQPDIADLGPLVSMHGGGLGTAMIESLAAQLDELPDTVVILDDLHQLSNVTLLEDLGQLVDVLPPHIHVVLASRVDLPIAWSRHRLRRGLTEIRQTELAFDESESARLLEHITGHTLGSDQVATLVQRTEGWVTGLQLAGMTLRVHDDSDAFITQFSGNDRLVADYLSEEVLQAQTDDRRRFLLRISVLDEMCSDLVAHLTGEPSPQLILEELERESMFLVPLDTHREWYRFHHLFRELLRYRLRSEDPLEEASLLRQAASWHLERGQVSPAVDYLLRARDWEGALDVIMARGSDVFERGEMATVIRWINQVPETLRAPRQDVNLLLATLKVAEGQAGGAEDILRRVAATGDATPGEQAAAQTLLSLLVQWRPRPDVSLEMADRALELLAHLGENPLPEIMGLTDARSLETVATISGGRAHFLAGHLDQARSWIERGLSTQGAAYSIWRVSGLGSLALVEAWAGRIERAEDLTAEALTTSQEVGLISHPSIADAYLAATLVALERGEPRRAALSLREGWLRAEANRRTQLSWVSSLLQASLEAADGRAEQAVTTMSTARHTMGAPPPPVVADRLVALRARLLRLGGSSPRAVGTLEAADLDSTSVAFEGAACALTLGQLDQARKILDGLPVAHAAEPLARVEHLALQAWLAEAEGFPDDVDRHLSAAVETAERHALVEAFVRCGPAVVRLIGDHPTLPPAFRETILRRARQVMAPAAVNELADPLTDRELEILSYLPSRLTNVELAGKCYVSVNTIKTHMAHIYRKLDVANRNEAIIRARQFGLL
jgi:LuxR family maltose regulon positive regulatory protein